MSDIVQIQIALNAAPDAIMNAWMDALPDWFAEHADVSAADKRYDFWGRYTPGAPDRAAGRHPLLDYQAGQSFKFSWALGGQDHDFTVSVQPHDGKQVVVVRQDGERKNPVPTALAYEDFWFLSLENLRRHLDGKPPVRCDFSASMKGDVHHSIEIDAPREAVYETLILPEQLERWIASHATVEPRVGGRYDFGWPNESGALRILEIVPNEKLALSWVEGERETIVTWTLEGSGGKTRLTLVHSGFDSDVDNEGIYAGWMNFMSWIKSLNEYGATWQPAVMRINPQFSDLYSGSINSGQADLIPPTEAQTPAEKPILGDYVEVLTAVADTSRAHTFYTSLGFQPVADNLLTDGSIYVRLQQGAFSSPTLYFMGADLSALERRLPGAERSGDQITFTAPNGLRVVATSRSSKVSMPDGAPMTRKPLTRLGKFGELAMSVTDFKAAAAFWQNLGFKPVHTAEEPYPYGIFTDGLILIGLHQSDPPYAPTLTYFAMNMAERIATLQGEHFTLSPIPPEEDGKTVYALLTSPDGQRFYLFKGEI